MPIVTQGEASGGGSSSIGTSIFAVFAASGGAALADQNIHVVWDTTVRDPDGWLNPDPYDSPDWEGESYVAKQTVILPPALYLIAYHGQLEGAAITLVDGDFACVDNRLANTLSDSWYAHGPSPTEDAQPNWLSSLAPGLAPLDAEHLIFVPTDATPGLVFSLFLRPHGDNVTSWGAGLSIQKISDWSAASS